MYNKYIRWREDNTSVGENNLENLKKCLTNKKTYDIINTTNKEREENKNVEVAPEKIKFKKLLTNKK